MTASVRRDGTRRADRDVSRALPTGAWWDGQAVWQPRMVGRDKSKWQFWKMRNEGEPSFHFGEVVVYPAVVGSGHGGARPD